MSQFSAIIQFYKDVYFTILPGRENCEISSIYSIDNSLFNS